MTITEKNNAKLTPLVALVEADPFSSFFSSFSSDPFSSFERRRVG